MKNIKLALLSIALFAIGFNGNSQYDEKNTPQKKQYKKFSEIMKWNI